MPNKVVLGNYHYSLSTNSLYLDDKLINLEPKFIEVLDYLVANKERYISVSELHDNVWKGRVVSDAAVRRVISRLRAILEKEPAKPKILVSATKRGYKINCIDYQADEPNNSTKNKQQMFSTPKSLSFVFVILSFLLAACYFVFATQLNDKNSATDVKSTMNEASLQHFNKLPINARFLDISPNKNLVLFQAHLSDRIYQFFIKDLNTDKTFELESDEISNVITFASFIDNQTIAIARNSLKNMGKLEIWQLDGNHDVIDKKIVKDNILIMDSLFTDEAQGDLFASYSRVKNRKFTYHRINWNADNPKSTPVTKTSDVKSFDFGGAISPNKQLIAYIRKPELEYEKEIQVMVLSTHKIVERIPYKSRVSRLQWLSNQELLILDDQGIKKLPLKNNASAFTTLFTAQNTQYSNMVIRGNRLFVSSASRHSDNYISFTLNGFQANSQTIQRPLGSLNLYHRSYQKGQFFETVKQGKHYVLQKVDIANDTKEHLLTHKNRMHVLSESSTGELLLSFNDGIALFHPRYKQLTFLNSDQEVVEDAIFDQDNFHILMGIKIDDDWGVYRYNPETKARTLLISDYRGLRIAKNGFVVKRANGELFYLDKHFNMTQALGIKLITIDNQSWYVKNNHLYWIDLVDNAIFKVMDLSTNKTHNVDINSPFYGQYFGFDSVNERFIFSKKDKYNSNLLFIELNEINKLSH